MNTNNLTPVIRIRSHWVKRDDMFEVAGAHGGKARTCWKLAQGASGLVTSGSRTSTQINIVAHVARHLGIPCHAHTTTGTLSTEVQMAAGIGAVLFQHKPGYTSVIRARAREDARQRGWTEIPFGMECRESVEATANEVANLPEGIKRVVLTVGFGMSLCGVMTGLRRLKRRLPVLGVVVGADPSRRLDQYMPFFSLGSNWRDSVQLIESGTPYTTPARDTVLDGLSLDPLYEAKCIPFLQTDDCLWIVGNRASQAEPRQERKEYSARMEV